MKKIFILISISLFLFACRKNKDENPAEIEISQKSKEPYSRFDLMYYDVERPQAAMVHLLDLKDEAGNILKGEHTIFYRIYEPIDSPIWKQKKLILNEGTAILYFNLRGFMEEIKLDKQAARLLFEFVIKNKMGDVVHKVQLPTFLYDRNNPSWMGNITTMKLYEYDEDKQGLGIDIDCFYPTDTTDLHIQLNDQTRVFSADLIYQDAEKKRCYFHIEKPADIAFDKNFRLIAWNKQDKTVHFNLFAIHKGDRSDNTVAHKYCLGVNKILSDHLPFNKYPDDNKLERDSFGKMIGLKLNLQRLAKEEIAAISPEGYNLWQCFRDIKKIVLRDYNFAALPESLAALQNLIHVEMYWTQLEKLPNFWLNLPLEFLDIQHSNLTNFPKELTKIKTLKHLTLITWDKTEFFIPDEIENLIYLESLRFNYMKIIQFPKCFFTPTFQNLKNFDLSFTGPHYFEEGYQDWKNKIAEIKKVYNILESHSK
jgi:hypothetical protein